MSNLIASTKVSSGVPDESVPAEEIEALIESHRGSLGALLPMLHSIQNHYGHIPEEAIVTLARVLRKTRAEVYGVITFYHDFRLDPPGRHIIKICRAEACQAAGGRALEAHAGEQLGLEFGQTSASGDWTLEAVYCLGNCACGPNMVLDDQIHARVTPERFNVLTTGVRIPAGQEDSV